jgi:predicted lactoylglutathione lyase
MGRGYSQWRDAGGRLHANIHAMEPRVSLVTLGVTDLQRSRRFYEELGFVTDAGPDDDVVFFQAGGMVLGLWDRGMLAEDSGVVDAGGWGGVTLAHNVRSEDDVDAVIAEARDAGADVVRDPAATPWGGYSGVFADPDGHTWEVAHNPFWHIGPNGAIDLTQVDGPSPA